MKPICALALCWLAAISATGTVNRQWAVGGEHKNPYDEILHTPEKSGGIYYAYPVTADQEPAIPSGYHPVAIVHYGRHGSRWAIKEAQYDIADSIFNYFQSRQLLTPLGTDIKRRIAIIGKHARGHSGELSPVGERQHRHIANRMLKRFPSLFVDSARIEARSSVEPRCIMSMAAFCEQLKEINPKLQIQRHATPADMNFIAYSTAEAKAHGNPSAQWRKTKYRFIDSVLTPDRFLTALITDTCGITSRQGRYMMQLLHDIAIAIQDVDGLDGMQIWDAFTPDEIYNLWQIVNYEMYFRHASATGNGNHGKQSAYSLLSHIITTADSALNGKLPAVNLHFGHDTNLIRLLALMGIDGCDNASDNPDNFALAWQGFRVSPMGANLQLVFYSNNNGNVLTLIRHNEQTATLPLEQQATGMYDWIKLKQFWTQRLKAIKHQKKNHTMRQIISTLSFIVSLSSFAAHPVEDLLNRIDSGASQKFVIIQTKSPTDFFEISTVNGKPAITGNSPVNIAAGLNWYLKYYPHIHLSWNNMHVEMPDSLPLPVKPERHETTATQRYYLNYCTHSYSMAFWDWNRWQEEIDWMALHGINMPLAMTGTDVVWANTLKRLGYNDEEISSFVAGPAFQAWWLMNNLEGWGGPNTPQWYADRAELQRKILARMRQLGMDPVLPGYSGMVPHDADERLGCQVSGKGIWNGFTRPAFIKTDDPLFERISGIYYDELTKLCGTSKYYSMDPFHEGGSLEGVDLAHCGSIIARAMKRANPDAVWVIQGWNENPRAELLQGVAKGDIVVLDLASEIKPNWGDPESPSPYKRPDGFWPHNWMYCMLLNFGGNVGLHGRMDCVINGYYKARQSKYGATLTGIGLTPEGIENNPVMFELQTELIWRPEKFTKQQWLASYAQARYGASDADIDSCWKKLSETIYNCPSGNLQQGTTESVFCARPSENVWQVSSWSRMKPYYEPQHVIDAAALFVKAADKFRNVENYNYDIVDIVRQAIAEKGRITYMEMIDALTNADTLAFDSASNRFLSLIKGQDELLNTRPEFKVGRWTNSARRLAHTPEQADLMEQNARLLITTWGPRVASEEGGLRDYGHREWAGLLSDLHHRRWEEWIALKRSQLQNNPAAFQKTAMKNVSASDAATDYVTQLPDNDKAKPVSEIDFYTIDEAWVNSRKHYTEAASANAVDTAVRLFRELCEN